MHSLSHLRVAVLFLSFGAGNRLAMRARKPGSDCVLHDLKRPWPKGHAQAASGLLIANRSRLEGGEGGAGACVIVTGTVRKQFFIF